MYYYIIIIKINMNININIAIYIYFSLQQYWLKRLHNLVVQSLLLQLEVCGSSPLKYKVSFPYLTINPTSEEYELLVGGLGHK